MPTLVDRLAIISMPLCLSLMFTNIGCGYRSPDLFTVARTTSNGARLEVVVSDAGTVRCNQGKARRLPDQQLLHARELARELDRLTARQLMLPPTREPIFSYKITTKSGTATFSDTSRATPLGLQKLAAFTKGLADNICQ